MNSKNSSMTQKYGLFKNSKHNYSIVSTIKTGLFVTLMLAQNTVVAEYIPFPETSMVIHYRSGVSKNHIWIVSWSLKTPYYVDNMVFMDIVRLVI